MPNFYYLQLGENDAFLFLGTASTFSIGIDVGDGGGEAPIQPGQGTIPPRVSDDDEDEEDEEDDEEVADDADDDEEWDIVFDEETGEEETTDETADETWEEAANDADYELDEEAADEVTDGANEINDDTIPENSSNDVTDLDEENDEFAFTSPEEIEELYDGTLLEETDVEETPITITPLLPSATSLPQNAAEASIPWVLIFSCILLGIAVLFLFIRLIKSLFVLREIRFTKIFPQILLLTALSALLWLATQALSPYISGLSHPSVYAGGELHFIFSTEEDSAKNTADSFTLSVSDPKENVLFEKIYTLDAESKKNTFYIQVPGSTSAGIHTLTLNGETHPFVVLPNLRF